MNTLALFAQEPLVWDLVTGLTALTVLYVVIALALTAFWLWMLIDALVNEPTPAEKLLWFVVIFLLPVIGAAVYFFVRKGTNRASPVI